MKVLIQRVSEAKVTVDGKVLGKIEGGLLALVGMEPDDNDTVISRMTDKLLGYRVFPDGDGRMNCSVQDIDGGILVVSQFTLAATTHKGLRPSFSSAAQPDEAFPQFERFVAMLKERHHKIEEGQFGADMKISLTNDGPVTFMLEIAGGV